MKYLQSRAKMGKRISRDSFNRWVMNRLPKNIPDDNKVIIIRGATNLLIQEGHVAKENNLDGVPMISLVKSLMDSTPQTTMNKGVV